MPGAERLVRQIQLAAKTPDSRLTDIVIGKVSSISPLKIKLDKLELSENFLELSCLCKKKEIELPGFTNPVQLWRGLKVGDTVKMLKLSNGQRYYVLEREGDLD
jgi:hypothetical protein